MKKIIRCFALSVVLLTAALSHGPTIPPDPDDGAGVCVCSPFWCAIGWPPCFALAQ